MDVLAFLANLGSLVGLAATLWAAWRAYRSRRYYLLVGRVPAGVEALRRNTRDLWLANSEPDGDRQDLLLALKGMRVALESIARNIGRKEGGEFDALARQIREIEKQDVLHPETLDDIYTEGEALTSKAEAIVEDKKFLPEL